jgi:hypothetical protein
VKEQFEACYKESTATEASILDFTHPVKVTFPVLLFSCLLPKRLLRDTSGGVVRIQKIAPFIIFITHTYKAVLVTLIK